MLDDFQKRQLDERIVSFRLAGHAKAITSLARLSIRLTVTDVVGAEDDSRLGGPAALPLEMSWPRWKDRDQALIAQLMMSDVAHLDRDCLLPSEGRLLFFYDQEQESWGFDPNDRGSWTVLFVGPETPTQTSERAIYPSRRLTPSSEICLPPWESLQFETLQLPAEETDAYIGLRDSLRSDGDLVTKVLGYPDPVQGAMEVECQFASNGIYCGNADAYKDPRAGELLSGARDWRLLLQVDSEEAAGMMWGDVGRLYYWIRESDLRSANFHAAWLVLQCC